MMVIGEPLREDAPTGRDAIATGPSVPKRDAMVLHGDCLRFTLRLFLFIEPWSFSLSLFYHKIACVRKG